MAQDKLAQKYSKQRSVSMIHGYDFNKELE